jgi:UDP-N-acetylmuramoyl-tripeptide--D-alanyl-D-alanine ligase
VTAHGLGLWARREVLDRLLFHGRPVVCALAFLWRRLLFRTTFVAITGSLGKTTARECVAACLAARFRTACARGDTNADGWLALGVLRVRPWHRYAVFEVAAAAPGRMARRLPFIKPDIAVVLGVARTHTTAYQSLEACATEKAQLLEALQPGGLAVLNADDPRVAAMRPPPGCIVRYFGVGADADVRGEMVSARWPEPLSFRVNCAGATETVQTQLIGAHWMPPVLAALAVAGYAGLTLQQAAAALRQVPPVTGRMQPVELPGGATVLRDDYNAAIDTLDAALGVLADARATRRILLVTDFSDSGQKRKHRLRYLARAAARSTEAVIFVGESAAYGGRQAIEAGMAPERVHTFRTLEETVRFLRSDLGFGDLLLLKGRTTDHVTRVFHALLGPIRCWKTTCRRRVPCDACWELGARVAVDPREMPLACRRSP